MDYSGFAFKCISLFRQNFRRLLTNHLSKVLCHLKGIKLGNNVKFDGILRSSRYVNSKIIIGHNCLFNSAKNSIYDKLYRPCNFVTLKPEAEIIFGNNSGASGVTIISSKSVKVGNHVLIGAHTIINDSDMHNSDPGNRLTNGNAKPIVIEDNVFIGYNCFILKGVRIGKNSIIGANSVVVTNIPPNSIALGNPCKVILKRNWESNSMIESTNQIEQ